MKHVSRPLIQFALISWFSMTVAQSQQIPDSGPTQPAQIKSSPSLRPGGISGQIVLDAVVTDNSGKPVSDLQPQDFTILDNGQPAKILSVRRLGGAPDLAHATEVVLVIDEVNCLIQTVQYERAGVKEFLAREGGKLPFPVSLAFFTEKGIQIQAHPSRDGNVLIAALNQHKLPPPRTGVSQGNGLVPSVQRLPDSLDAFSALIAQEQETPWKKMVLWLGHGWPTETGSLSSKDEERVFNSVVSYSTALRQARITLYSIDPLHMGGTTPSFFKQFMKLTSPDGAVSSNLALQTIAAQTGGFTVFGSESIANLISLSTPDLDAFYTLSIEAPQAKHANEYHSLDLRVATPGLTVRTRTGYYAQP